ncbi:hypothetical protein [Dyadobacter luticola]|uniref:Exo-alpha-sialidase n=1 Tax=Dyadobacter luticola TaxID=1979387 RepID=A0A5R9L2D0_9BACT|nr:hypothetical protein [Dyadobacter luticola]TLV02499.1 hypothetical protein FEN17_02410 [Dyadobacter luticola]
MKVFLYAFLLLAALSCKKSDVDIVESDTVLSEYPDWYTLKSPVDRQIEGVWGNYDKTVLISTMSKIFRTTDQGKHWDLVHEQSTGMFGVVQYQDTLFTMSGLSNQTRDKSSQQVLVQADNFSTDDGKTWQKYTAINPALGEIPEFDSPEKFLINPIVAPTKVTYQIFKAFRDENATVGNFTTPGVVKSTGERIDLPQLHQLQSLYFDDQQRLYIVGSDAVCGTEESFKFCNSKGGRGVVYVSKKALP